MKLSKRIRDLVRANVTSPRRLPGLGKAKSPAKMEAQLEQIRKSLTGAVTREKQLQDDLALAEREGREQDTVRLQRELADLSQSVDELQGALDLIEARIELERKTEAGARHAMELSSATGDEDPAATSLAADGEAEESDLATRKSRLAAPLEEQGKSP